MQILFRQLRQRRKAKKGKNGDEEDHLGRTEDHRQQQQDSSKPSSKL